MSRPRKEIVQDIYFKKIEMRFMHLCGDTATWDEVQKNLDRLCDNMIRNCPAHIDRIKECAGVFVGVLRVVADRKAREQ